MLGVEQGGEAGAAEKAVRVLQGSQNATDRLTAKIQAELLPSVREEDRAAAGARLDPLGGATQAYVDGGTDPCASSLQSVWCCSAVQLTCRFRRWNGSFCTFRVLE